MRAAFFALLFAATFFSSSIRASQLIFGPPAPPHVTPPVMIMAPQPFSLMLESVEEGAIHFRFTRTEGTFSYVLQRSLEVDGRWQNISGELSDTSGTVSDTTVQPSTAYMYRLCRLPLALSELDNRTTYLVSATSKGDVLPPSPAHMGVSSVDGSKLQLVWAKVALATHGYKIERRPALQMTWKTISTPGPDVTTYKDTRVVEGQSYYYRISSSNALGDSEPLEDSFVRKAVEMPILLQDDFEPDVDFAVWINLRPETFEARNVEVGGNGTNILRLWRSGVRELETRSARVSGGGSISFSLRAGNAERDGSTDWDNTENGSIVVSFKTQGDLNWKELRTIDMAYPALSDWTEFNIPLPTTAYSPGTQFRLQQSGSPALNADTWAIDNLVIRGGPNESLSVVTQPMPIIEQVNSPLISRRFFRVMTNKIDVTFQWFKGEVEIAGATQHRYAPDVVTPEAAGLYHCRISDGVSVIETQPAMLVAVEPMPFPDALVVPLGGSFTLGTVVYPSEAVEDCQFTWRMIRDSPMDHRLGTVVGQNTPMITVSDVTADAGRNYTCKIIYQNSVFVEAGEYVVRLLPKPTITPVLSMNVVAKQALSVPLNISDATSVTVTGLPPDLTFDAATNRIIGTTVALQSYAINVEAENASGTAVPVTFMLNVLPYPEQMAGTYRGVLMQGEAPFDHGGQVAFQITKNGGASGSVTLAGKTSHFISVVNAAVADGSAGTLKATFKDKAGTVYGVTVDISNFHRWDNRNTLSEVTVSQEVDGETQPLLRGYAVRNLVRAERPQNAMLINVALQPGVEEPDLERPAPKGVGFMSLRVSLRGTVNINGRLADGKAVTASTMMGSRGDVPVFINAYKHTGSVTMLVKYADKIASGEAYWNKADQGAKSKDRAYKQGFALQPLTVQGGLYVRPAVLESVLLHGASYSSLTLTLSKAEMDEILQRIQYTKNQKPVLSRDPELNPYGITHKVNVATGLFTGTFKLEDEDLGRPGKLLRRTVTYQGCVIPGQKKGFGFFLLPDLPSVETPKNTPLWSGHVVLRHWEPGDDNL